MKDYLFVAAGGAIGACARYGLSVLVNRSVNLSSFPIATFTVNVIGCVLAGLLIAAAEKYDLVPAQARLFLMTGILGGFTTFSAFGVETIALLRKGDLATAFGYVLLSVICGLAALWIAYGLVPGRKF
jgi:fluoride exporter